MTWVFDVDGCLIDSLTGTSLRPGAAALLESLRERGNAVVLWSAGGAHYARARASEQGIDALVDAFHSKSGRDADGRSTPRSSSTTGPRTSQSVPRSSRCPRTCRMIVTTAASSARSPLPARCARAESDQDGTNRSSKPASTSGRSLCTA
jgi:hypothetical protein